MTIEWLIGSVIGLAIGAITLYLRGLWIDRIESQKTIDRFCLFADRLSKEAKDHQSSEEDYNAFIKQLRSEIYE